MTIDQVPTGRVRVQPCAGYDSYPVLKIEVRVGEQHYFIPASANDLQHAKVAAWVEDSGPRLGSLIDTTA